MAELLARVDWEQREIRIFGRQVVQPRLIAWAGSHPYRYSGQTLPPRAPDQRLAQLIDSVSRATQVTFNQVLLNRYRDGHDCMGFHADNEPELGPQPVVASLSLGVARRFVVRSRQRPPRINEEFLLAHGDLLVMGGTCQQHLVHGVPRQRRVAEERISLTFRRVLCAPRRRSGFCATSADR